MLKNRQFIDSFLFVRRCVIMAINSAPMARAVVSIQKSLSEVSGELIAIEKRWRTWRDAHHALSQTLRMFADLPLRFSSTGI